MKSQNVCFLFQSEINIRCSFIRLFLSEKEKSVFRNSLGRMSSSSEVKTELTVTGYIRQQSKNAIYSSQLTYLQLF